MELVGTNGWAGGSESLTVQPVLAIEVDFWEPLYEERVYRPPILNSSTGNIMFDKPRSKVVASAGGLAIPAVLPIDRMIV